MLLPFDAQRDCEKTFSDLQGDKHTNSPFSADMFHHLEGETKWKKNCYLFLSIR